MRKSGTRNILGPPSGRDNEAVEWDPFAGIDALATNGAALLDRVEAWLRRFVAPPSPEAMTAIVLWAAHAHCMDAWDSTPRLFFSSPEPGSGKSRGLELVGALSPRTVEAVNATPSYLFRKVEDPAGRPTICYDEIDNVLGPKITHTEEVRGFLNAGHRRGAVAGRCVVKGKTVEVEELPAFCAVAMAGLGYLPDTILSRCVIVRMRRRAPDEVIEPYRRRLHEAEGHELRDDLADWAAVIEDRARAMFPAMPAEVVDRNADVWEPLIVMADIAGGHWPDRARVSAVTLVSDAMRKPPSLGLRLLADLRAVFGDDDQVSTATLLERLHALDEAPWSDLKGKPLDPRGLSRMLGDYEIKSLTIRLGLATQKGYRRADLHDAWQRYLGETPKDADTTVTPVTDATSEPGGMDWFDG